MAGMDAVPKEMLRRAYQRKHIHLLKIPFMFGLWFGVAVLLYKTQHHAYAIPIGIACSMLVAYIIRGLGTIAHDAVHGTVFQNKLGSYLVSLLCWSPSGLSVTIYANYHLHHHRITNTYADVDNFVVTDYTRNPVLAKALLLLVYGVGYPIYFMFAMFKYVKRLSIGLKVRMYVELAGIFSTVGVAAYFMPTQVFVFFYGLPFLMGAYLASQASLIEHYEMPETDDDAYSSRTYGTTATFTNFLWNNVTYHNEHHKFPGIPYYNLASFYHEASPHYDERVKANCHETIYSLAFSLYLRILKVDIEALDERYRAIGDKKAKKANKTKMLGLPGISPESSAT